MCYYFDLLVTWLDWVWLTVLYVWVDCLFCLLCLCCAGMLGFCFALVLLFFGFGLDCFSFGVLMASVGFFAGGFGCFVVFWVMLTSVCYLID